MEEEEENEGGEEFDAKELEHLDGDSFDDDFGSNSSGSDSDENNSETDAKSNKRGRGKGSKAKRSIKKSYKA